ncbi:MDR family MFS transporter [Paenibacillus tarimensis]
MEELDHRRKIMIMVAVMAALLFAALNQTIVSTALPTIIERLGGMEYYSWVFTVYMLTSSITTILVGKLSDIYGRKPFILFGIGLFVIGSLLCGLSQTIMQLIIYRGIQGLAGGMILSTAFTAIGDLFAPRERGRWQGLMTGAFGLASVFGPTLGGYIVDHTDWHWVFWVFLPFGIVAFVMILLMFPKVERKRGESIDYPGSLFLTLVMVPLLLAFSWAGTTYPWASVPIAGLFIGSAVALILFIVSESRAHSPVIPLQLFRDNIYTLSNVVSFLLGAGMFSAIMYMPWFIQGVMGTSATISGYIVMPMTLSLVLGSAVGGQLMTRTGKYKMLALAGIVIMAVGMAMLSTMNTATTPFIAIVNMVITGLGLGLAMPVFTLTVQNTVEDRMLGVATASSQLFRSLGGTIGVSVMSTVMAHRLSDKLLEAAPLLNPGTARDIPAEAEEAFALLQNPQSLLDPGKLEQAAQTLPAELQEIYMHSVTLLREALGYSLSGVFIAGAAVMVVAFALTLMLKEIPLRGARSKGKPEASSESNESGGTGRKPAGQH